MDTSDYYEVAAVIRPSIGPFSLSTVYVAVAADVPAHGPVS